MVNLLDLTSDQLGHLDDFEYVEDGIDYMRSIGMGRSADAIEAIVVLDERQRDAWPLCDCGARRPLTATGARRRCPVCDDDETMPCICVEYNRYSKKDEAPK